MHLCSLRHVIFHAAIVVFLTGCGSSSQNNLNDSAGNGIQAPSSQSITLNASSTVDSTKGAFLVTFNKGAQAAWTATSDRSWLVLGKAGDSGAGSLPYSLDLAQISNLPSGSKDIATITINANGLTSVTTQVRLEMNLPDVTMVQPALLAPGSSSQFRVYGRGFSQLASGSAFSVAGISDVNGTILSDQQAVLQVGPLTVGHHAVFVSPVAGLSGASADLVVATPISLPHASISLDELGEGVSSVVFDPARTAIFIANNSTNTLDRYTWSAGAWNKASVPVASILELNLSFDRKSLYVTARPHNLFIFDPDTLTIKETFTSTFAQSFSLYGQGLQLTSNNRIWMFGSQWTQGYSFDLTRHEFGFWQGPESLYSPMAKASGDGSVMAVSSEGISPPQFGSLYTSASDSVKALDPVAFSDISFSFDGSRMILNGLQAYDTHTLKLLGQIPIQSNYIFRAVLACDGTLAYCPILTDSSTEIDVYDLNQTEPLTGNFVKLGTFSSPDPIGSLYYVDHPLFFISSMGDTLFLSGHGKLLILPIPTNLAKPITSARLVKIPNP